MFCVIFFYSENKLINISLLLLGSINYTKFNLHFNMESKTFSKWHKIRIWIITVLSVQVEVWIARSKNISDQLVLMKYFKGDHLHSIKDKQSDSQTNMCLLEKAHLILFDGYKLFPVDKHSSTILLIIYRNMLNTNFCFSWHVLMHIL